MIHQTLSAVIFSLLVLSCSQARSVSGQHEIDVEAHQMSLVRNEEPTNKTNGLQGAAVESRERGEELLASDGDLVSMSHGSASLSDPFELEVVSMTFRAKVSEKNVHNFKIVIAALAYELFFEAPACLSFEVRAVSDNKGGENVFEWHETWKDEASMQAEGFFSRGILKDFGKGAGLKQQDIWYGESWHPQFGVINYRMKELSPDIPPIDTAPFGDPFSKPLLEFRKQQIKANTFEGALHFHSDLYYAFVWQEAQAHDLQRLVNKDVAIEAAEKKLTQYIPLVLALLNPIPEPVAF